MRKKHIHNLNFTYVLTAQMRVCGVMFSSAVYDKAPEALYEFFCDHAGQRNNSDCELYLWS